MPLTSDCDSVSKSLSQCITELWRHKSYIVDSRTSCCFLLMMILWFQRSIMVSLSIYIIVVDSSVIIILY